MENWFALRPEAQRIRSNLCVTSLAALLRLKQTQFFPISLRKLLLFRFAFSMTPFICVITRLSVVVNPSFFVRREDMPTSGRSDSSMASGGLENAIFGLGRRISCSSNLRLLARKQGHQSAQTHLISS